MSVLKRATDAWSPELGAVLGDDGVCRFCVWAPLHEEVAVQMVAPHDRVIAMRRDAHGYHRAAGEQVEPGALYTFRLSGGNARPDPASRCQPQGVHGPSEVVGSTFDWTDQGWAGRPLPEYIIYELHVGTFTPEGTFEAVIPYLDGLAALGVTALEIMPVGQFPGTRNWGYDGVGLFAPQFSYGGPTGLKRLVDACHARGLAVILDVVYNHLGPEGNYLHEFGPYFTDRYRTPWGSALNFDGPGSDHVRRLFIENALYWITDFHIDALRLDATHAMLDFSAETVVEALAAAVHEQASWLNRRIYVIAENDRSDDRLLRPAEAGGYGLDAQWSDDLHHVLHTLLTREQFGYYEDFGLFPQLVKALRFGYVYSGDYSVFRQRRHGTFSPHQPGWRFIVCSQNHDQVGNRMNGDRLGHLVSFAGQKLAAGVVLLSPYIPLLFMGEEYGETAPFLYFTSMEDLQLGRLISEGRRSEFAGHRWQGEAPDPQAPATFERSKLNHDLRHQGHHRVLHDYYAGLIRLRTRLPALRRLDKDQLEVIGYEREQVIFMRRWHESSDVIVLFHFGDTPAALTLPVPQGRWQPVFYSADPRWAGEDSPGEALPAWDEHTPVSLVLAPISVAVFVREETG